MKTIELDYPKPLPPSKSFQEYDYEEHAYLNTLRREMVADSCYPPQRQLVIEDTTVNGWKEKIRIRIYRQEQEKMRPVMLYMHGGAYCAGSIEFTDDYCKAVADLADIAVVSVDYHLSPEFPFPHGVEDCYAVLQWIWDEGDGWNFDKNEIALAGDSAGGNFSAVLSQMAKDRGKINVKNQILLYAGLSKRPEDGSGGDNEYARRSMALVTGWYVGDADPLHPYLSPLEVDSFTGLPRSFLVVCELDGMRFKEMEYAHKLDDAGVDVTVAYLKNTPHAFITRLGKMPQGIDTAKLTASWLCGPR